jgi:pyruvate dehydrogenase E2 component (dihydrolipoamide acetyltransferase)
MKQGTLTKWYKKEGEPVQKGDLLFEVETEKITNMVEAYVSGILFQIIVHEGETIPVGTILAIIAEPGEEPERIEGIQMGTVTEVEPAFAKPSEKEAKVEPAAEKERKFVPASPAARRLAKELGVNLDAVSGTGPKGRIIERDVQRYHDEGPPPPKATPLAMEIAGKEGLDLAGVTGTGEGGRITKEDVERKLKTESRETEAPLQESIPFQGMRKAVADAMFTSLHDTAQLTQFTEVDVTGMARFRDEVLEEHGSDETVRISYNDIIVLATSRALKRFPIMNATLVDEEIRFNQGVNMGIAVALEQGLIVPVLMDADKKGLLQIAREVRELARKAREGALSVDEVSGGTFTITNLSKSRVDGFTPILKPRETGILGVGRVIEKPAVHEGRICIRPMMYLSLTFDHRVVDGAPAAGFLETVAKYIERPNLIMS